MRTSVYLKIICFCAIVLVNGCKHHKSVATRPKNKKQPPTVKTSTGEDKTKTAPATVKNSTSSQVLEQKLGLTEKEIRNSKLFLFISDWYGVPYKYGGCQKTGIDCSCFTNLLYEKVYHIKTARSADDIYNNCEKILLDEMREGDLIFFKINSNSVSHVGVYLRKNLFVHSSTSKGVIINSVDEAYYKKYFHSGGRIKNS